MLLGFFTFTWEVRSTPGEPRPRYSKKWLAAAALFVFFVLLRP
jgi:hypothetical protein